jgi:hypothetical protein
MTSPGIEFAAFRLVAWCLYQLRYRVTVARSTLSARLQPELLSPYIQSFLCPVLRLVALPPGVVGQESPENGTNLSIRNVGDRLGPPAVHENIPHGVTNLHPPADEVGMCGPTGMWTVLCGYTSV